MSITMALGGMVASLVAATSGVAPATAATAPADASVQVVTVNGSGCPAGSGDATLSDDGFSFTITSTPYFASAGLGAGPLDFRKNCQYSVQVNRPEGWTYAVAGVEASGFAFLSAGATGLSRSSIFFQGQATTTVLSRTFTGPLSDNWQTKDSIGLASLVYAPCGVERNLNINTELRVVRGTAAPNTSNFLFRNESSTYRLFWKQCA